MNRKFYPLLLAAAFSVTFLNGRELLAGESEPRWTLECSASTAIHSARFFPESGEMEVVFHSNQSVTYRYVDVPASLWQAWVAALSKGRFFHARIAEKPFKEPANLARSD